MTIASGPAIARSSLILKLSENTVLELWGGLLQSDGLKFGFKRGASTTQCTWLVQEVIQHNLRSGSNPALPSWITPGRLIWPAGTSSSSCCCQLLPTVAKLPAIVVTVLLYSYENQFSWARWGTARSAQFRIKNGTHQGFMYSPDTWCCCTDPLLERLQALGVGCRLAGLLMGAFLYSDDHLLIAPNR